LEDSEKFYPERFLDSNGSFKKDLGHTFFFGLGKRKCPGEVLGRAEVTKYT